MLTKKIETALNKQIRIEAESSQIYLAMAVWAETNGFDGIAEFMYGHADEERMHMLKIISYVNDRGGVAIISDLIQPKNTFKNPQQLFEAVLKHEIYVSKTINQLVDLTFEVKDFATHNFLQWYVSEQIEEEGLFRKVLDRLKLIDDKKNGFYMFDRDIKTLINEQN